MITALHRRKLLPVLAMLFALAGMSLSVIGEAFSHGGAEIAGTADSSFDGHPHSHDAPSALNGDKAEVSKHHDSGNHTHETVDRLAIPLVSGPVAATRLPIPFSGDAPRSFRYRLERPPKAVSTT